MSYYDANGDGRSLGGGDHVGGVIPHEVCSCGGALYLDRDSDAAALPCAKLGFRAKVFTTCGKVSTSVRRYKEVAQGEPGFGAWVPFVPSLLVCMNGRALSQENCRRGRRERPRSWFECDGPYCEQRFRMRMADAEKGVRGAIQSAPPRPPNLAA